MFFIYKKQRSTNAKTDFINKNEFKILNFLSFYFVKTKFSLQVQKCIFALVKPYILLFKMFKNLFKCLFYKKIYFLFTFCFTKW